MPIWEVAQWISASPRLENRETWATRYHLGLGIGLETQLLRFSHSTAAVLGNIRRTAEQFRWCPIDAVGRSIHEFQNPVRAPLLAETEFLNHSLIAIGIVGFEIVEQATPLADQHEQAAARAVVLLVRLEVFRQGANAFAQQSDLNFRTTGVGSMGAVLVDEGFFLLSG